MKNIKLFVALSVMFYLSIQLKAQVTLPYYSAFDNADQQNGWIEYKTESTQFSHWGYGSFNAYSAPNCIGHDYSPSTGIELTDNWFVSPGFSINNGGKLDSIRYKFMGFSNPEVGDTIAIYLLSGSQDPSFATKTLLFDFRGSEYLTDNTYRVKADITLPPASGFSYFAFRYRNTDCSSKWLTVFFDNIAISGGTVDINEFEETNEIAIYPNPTVNGKFYMSYLGTPTSIRVFNCLGQEIHNLQIPVSTLKKVEIDLSNQINGIYIIEVFDAGKNYTKKIVHQ